MNALLSIPESVFFLTAILQSLAIAEEVQEPPIVANVVVIGNAKVPISKVREHFKVQPSERFSLSRAYAGVDALANAGLFKRVGPVRTRKLSDGRVSVILEVSEFPTTIREVDYLHSRLFTPRQLADITKVQVGKPQDRWRNQAACFLIQEHLRDRGHFFANVSLEEGYDESHERVVFSISEGPKVCFRRIRVFERGSLPFGAELTESMAGVERGEIFSYERIEHALDNLERFYRSRGYLDAEASREVKFSDDFANVDVTFFVGFGKRYQVAEWAIEGRMDRAMRRELERLIKVKKGDYHSEAAVAADERSVTEWGARLGKRLTVRADVYIIPDKPTTVGVRYKLDDAPVDRVGTIRIVGNTVTRDEVIRKNITLKSGQILDYTQIPIIQKRLINLEIFKVDPDLGIQPTVNVVVPNEESQPNVKDVVINVEETATGMLWLSASASRQKGIVLRAVIEERNFDPCWPKSWGDVLAGRLFRGAGQRFRMDSGEIQIFPPSSP